jgi:hypothetical protein
VVSAKAVVSTEGHLPRPPHLSRFALQVFCSLFCRNDQSALRMSLVSGTLRRFSIDQWL